MRRWLATLALGFVGCAATPAHSAPPPAAPVVATAPPTPPPAPPPPAPAAPDADGDGVADADDCCPTESAHLEIAWRRLSRPTPLVVTLHFDRRRDRPSTDAASALDVVAQALAARPEVIRLEVAGHADNTEPNAQALSEARARAVVADLVARGVDPARLVARGYGFDRPIAPNQNARGRASNRRVNFTVIEILATENHCGECNPTGCPRARLCVVS